MGDSCGAHEDEDAAHRSSVTPGSRSPSSAPVAYRQWQACIDYYRDWTIIANGAGIPKDEQIDGEPDSWNGVYFQLAADCLMELSIEEASALMARLFDRLPHEPLFENLKLFLEQTDELFFNHSSISSDLAVSVRTVAGTLIQSTRAWKRLQNDRTLSSEMKISGLVAKFYFNTSGGGFSPSKCYLKPVAIPRITPFLGLFQGFALDGQCPLIGLVALNMIEVAPSPEHLGFLISLGSAWIAAYPDSTQFWSEYQFGKRLCNLLEGILSHSRQQSSPVELQALDQLLSHLVRLGLPEAHRAEEVLRTYMESH